MRLMTTYDPLVGSRSRRLLSKVPEVTIYFWVIKVLCTTVGETAADFLNVNLNFGLVATSVVTGILLVGAWSCSSARIGTFRAGTGWRSPWSVSSARW
jgi:uncharacterized membrane-anchored protein